MSGPKPYSRKPRGSSSDISSDFIEFSDMEKSATGKVRVVERVDSEEEEHHTQPVSTARDLVTEIIIVEDDPTENPWTVRTWVLGETHDFDTLS